MALVPQKLEKLSLVRSCYFMSPVRSHPEGEVRAVGLVQKIRGIRKIQREPSRLLGYGEPLPVLHGGREPKAVGAVHLSKGDSCKCRLKLSFPHSSLLH